jgi:hypothetical protein
MLSPLLGGIWTFKSGKIEKQKKQKTKNKKAEQSKSSKRIMLFEKLSVIYPN